MSDNKPILIIAAITLITFFGVIFLATKTATKDQASQNVNLGVLVTETTHVKGEASASAVLVEFSDFQCPACGTFYPILKNLKEKYGSNLALAYKHFPLPSHQFARKAAEAAEAAGAQGKFWEYHDVLFENQGNLKPEDLKKYAAELGLNIEQFNADLDSGKYSQTVSADIDVGSSLGVNSTPTFYLNGKRINLSKINDLEIEIQKVLNLSQSNNEPVDTDESIAEPEEATQTETIVNVSDTAFEPKDITVKVGDKVTWKNNGSKKVWVASAPHPSHTNYPEFDELEGMITGGSWSFTFDKIGVWKYHDHLNPSYFGSVTVTE